LRVCCATLNQSIGNAVSPASCKCNRRSMPGAHHMQMDFSTPRTVKVAGRPAHRVRWRLACHGLPRRCIYQHGEPDIIVEARSRAAGKGRVAGPNLRPCARSAMRRVAQQCARTVWLGNRSVPCRVAAGVGLRACCYAGYICPLLRQSRFHLLFGAGEGTWYSNTYNCIFIQYREEWIPSYRTAVATTQ